MSEKISVVMDRRQILSIIKQLSPPIVYDSKCTLCGAEFILVPEEGFIMKPGCGDQCGAQVLREAYNNEPEAHD